MTCDRVRELFSDYIEGGLERATAMAAEAHVTACTPCLQALEELRHTWQDLDHVPAVTPPQGLEERVIAAMARDRQTAQLRAHSPAGPAWLTWLRSLNLVQVGFATSVATLIIVGAWAFQREWVPDPLGPWPRSVRTPPVQTAVTVPAASQDVGVTVEYGKPLADSQSITLVLQTKQTLPNARVAIRRPDSSEFLSQGEGTMLGGRAYRVVLDLRRTSAAPERLYLDIAAPEAGVQQRFFCAIPLEPRSRPETVSATFVETPLETALSQMAEKLGRPVVAEARVLDKPVTVAVSDRTASQAWRDILGPFGVRVVEEQGTYRVVPD